MQGYFVDDIRVPSGRSFFVMLGDEALIQPFSTVKVQFRHPLLFHKGFDLSSAEGLNQLSKDGFVHEQAFVPTIMHGCTHLVTLLHRILLVRYMVVVYHKMAFGAIG